MSDHCRPQSSEARRPCRKAIRRTVPLAPAVALGGLDQLLDFALGEVLAWPKLTVGARVGVTVRFTVAGETSLSES